MACWVYILECADGSYYTGSHRGPEIETRVWEHNNAIDKGSYTSSRLPVKLVWAEFFESIIEAIEFERQLKGWNRTKKQAVIDGRWDDLPKLAERGPAVNKEE